MVCSNIKNALTGACPPPLHGTYPELRCPSELPVNVCDEVYLRHFSGITNFYKPL